MGVGHCSCLWRRGDPLVLSGGEARSECLPARVRTGVGRALDTGLRQYDGGGAGVFVVRQAHHERGLRAAKG